jgi:LytTr DNA-binding domain-containing protein
METIKDFFRQKDVRLFLVLIPVIKFIDCFMTFSEVVFDKWFFIAFAMNVFQGYACLIPIRWIIKRIEKQQKGMYFSKTGLAKQLVFTFLATVAICIIVPDGAWLITGKRYTDSSVHDITMLFVWIALVNFIYIGLRYYEIWKISEEKLQSERKLKTEGITIKIGDKNIKIPLKDIRGFYVENGATFIINSNFTTFIVDSSLDNLEQKLPDQYFFRVNRKYILHRRSIVSFKRIEDNKLLISTLAENPLPGELPMSRLKAPAFKKWFEEGSA